MNRVFTMIGLVGAVALICGCGPAPGRTGQTTAASPAAGTAAKPKVIGASLLSKTQVFYQDLSSAMAQAAKAHGYKLIIQYAEFKGAVQNNDIETFITQKVDAIIVSPVDSSAIAPVIDEARSKGIPVFTVDIAAHGANVVSHIASDNVEGGRLIGNYLAKLLHGEGNIAIVDHPEAASVQERTKGFVEAIKKYPRIHIIQRVEGGAVRDKALAATQDLLQANPDLDGIFGINDDSALGALAAVEEAGKQNKIVIVGYDGTPEARQAILAGRALKADTVQYPKEMGRKTIEVIADYFAGKKVPKMVPVRVGIIDAKSLRAAAAK